MIQFFKLILLGILLLPSMAHAEILQQHEFTIDVNGTPRTFQIHNPTPAPVNIKNGLPLVIVLHGGRSSGDQIAKASRFSDKADKHGFIAVYPDGTGKIEGRRLTWNAGECCDLAMEEHADDITFLEKLIDYMIKFQGADPRHIYLAGMSNGGMLAHRAGAELSDKLAGIGIVEGGMFASQPTPKSPVSILMIHGRADRVIPLEGGVTESNLIKPYMKEGSAFLSAEEALEFWRKNNGCNDNRFQGKRGRIVHEIYDQCRENTVAMLEKIQYGAHNWPGSPKMIYSEFDDGSSFMGYDATDILWEFFARQRNINIQEP